jgi:TonB family protein
MNWINYLLEANLYLVLFYAVYYMLLRRDTHYQLNRVYLLATSLLSFVIPFTQLGFLKHPVNLPEPVVAPINYEAYIPTAQNAAPVIATPAVHINYYLLVYIGIAAVMAIGLAIRIYQLAKMARKGKHTAGNDFKLIELDEEAHAFSFFGYLFISKKLSASLTIIQHELVHIRQKHSLDILYVEVLKIVCWFNPVVYLMQNSIKELHEFIADNYTATNQDVNAYTDFLISNAYGLSEASLHNNFFNKNLLKNRIMMLHQKRSGNLARLKYLVALPLLAGMLCTSTLAFTKDYSLIDLAPAAKKAENPAKSQAKIIPTLPAPPAQPKHFIYTKKGFKYAESVWHVNGKSLFRVSIVGKDSIQNDYFKDSVSAEDIKMLKDKYGYSFPVNPQLPPPPPPSPPMAVKKSFADLARFVRRVTHYTKEAYAYKTNAAVVAEFNLTNGFIKDIKIAQSAGHGLDEAVIKALANYPKLISDKDGDYKIGVKFFYKEKNTMPTVDAKLSGNANYIADLVVANPVMTPPMVDQVKFPPPMVKKPASLKKIVDQVRFPPPVGADGKALPDTGRAAYTGLYKQLARTIRYPADARDANIQGKVFVAFTVNADGKVDKVSVLRGLYDSQDGEVIRALKACILPSVMKPGVNYTVPITFCIKDKNENYIDGPKYINKTPKPYESLPADNKNYSLNEVVVVGFK